MTQSDCAVYIESNSWLVKRYLMASRNQPLNTAVCSECAPKQPVGLDASNSQNWIGRMIELSALVPEPTLSDVLWHINSERDALRASLLQVHIRREAGQEMFRRNPELLALLLCDDYCQREPFRTEDSALSKQLALGNDLLQVLKIEACTAAAQLAVAHGMASCPHAELPDEPTGSPKSITVGESY